jgi:hypothetical protein
MPLFQSKDDKEAARATRERAKEARRQRDTNPDTRWEYKVVWVRRGAQKGAMGSRTMELAFNKVGSQGWELVAVEEERATFKRRILELSEAEKEELATVEVPGDDDEE